MCSTLFCLSTRTVKGVKDSEISFHTFPRCPKLRKRWIKAMKRENWEPSRYSRLCSKHFEKSSFVPGLSKKKLKSNAVPTIFEGCPVNWQMVQKSKPLNSKQAVLQSHEDVIDNSSCLSDHVTFKSTLLVNPETGSEMPFNIPGSDLQYQNTSFSVVEVQQNNYDSEMSTDIVVKEELIEDEHQCRLCLSFGRKMSQLGELGSLYKELLFDKDNESPVLPGLMSQIKACWECRGILSKIKLFQKKVRKANYAFEMNQNLYHETLSNMSIIKSNDTDMQTLHIDLDKLQDNIQEMVEIKIEINEDVYQSENILTEDIIPSRLQELITEDNTSQNENNKFERDVNRNDQHMKYDKHKDRNRKTQDTEIEVKINSIQNTDSHPQLHTTKHSNAYKKCSEEDIQNYTNRLKKIIKLDMQH